MTDYTTQISPSNRATCCKCRCKILKGEPRFKKHGTYRNVGYYYYFCYNCAYKIITEERAELTALHKELGNLKRKCSKAIVMNSLTNNKGRTTG